MSRAPSADTPTMGTSTQRTLTFAEIDRYVVAAAPSLLAAAYGQRVEASEDGAVDTAKPMVMSVIGLAADGVRCSLLLLASRDAVATVVPEAVRTSGVPPEAAVCDVLGELANLLAGRVKNDLLAHAVHAFSSTPTTMLGDEIAIPVPRSGMSAWHRFAGGDFEMFVRLDTMFDPGFELAPAEDARAVHVAEGEFVLF